MDVRFVCRELLHKRVHDKQRFVRMGKARGSSGRKHFIYFKQKKKCGCPTTLGCFKKQQNKSQKKRYESPFNNLS